MAKSSPTFGFATGRKVGRHYVVESLLGGGSEGEVYRIREVDTGIVRAAKFYFPDHDPIRRRAIRHAQKLNALRFCPIVLQYHHTELIRVGKQEVTVLISDLCSGQPLEPWIAMQKGKRVGTYMAMHLLHQLACGLESIHALGQYHADVHSQNILIQPRGVQFDLKLIDFYEWGRPSRGKQQQDIRDSVAVFFECLGGRKHYGQLPAEVRRIICGMKRQQILERYPTMTALRQYLETFEWTALP